MRSCSFYRDYRSSLLCLGLITCAPHTCGSPDPIILPNIQFHGCDAVFRGPVCGLEHPAQLTVWVEGTTSQLSLYGGQNDDAGWHTFDGGKRASVNITPTSEALVISSASWRQNFVLPIRPLSRTLTRSRWAQIQRDLSLARQAQHQGQWNRALNLRTQIIEAAQRQGLISELVKQRVSQAYIHYYHQGDFEAARQLIEAASADAAGYPAAQIHIDYAKAMLARQTHDLQTTLRAFDRAARGAERLHMTSMRWAIGVEKCTASAEMGIFDEAIETIIKLKAASPPMPSCWRTQAMVSWAWTALLAKEAGHPVPPLNATDLLNQAKTEFDDTCPNAGSQANVWTNLAFAALQNHQPKAARHALDEARRLEPDPRPEVRMWSQHIEGLIALRNQDAPRALRLYTELADWAERTDSAEHRWRASLGQARALRDMHQIDRAIAAYQSAERHLNAQGLFIELGRGRGEFMANRQTSAQELIDLLIDQGRHEDAVSAARAARIRILAQLHRASRLSALSPDARQRWEHLSQQLHRQRQQIDAAVAESWSLSQQELEAHHQASRQQRARHRELMNEALALLQTPGVHHSRLPVEDHLLLGYHPTPEGWMGFALDRDQTKVVRLAPFPDNPSPQDWSNILLAPFKAELGQHTRIRILPYGPLTHVDFHALPWQGRPLIETHIVLYTLDLDLPRPSRTGHEAVVITDPLGDLPMARDEGEQAARRLRAQGWSVETHHQLHATTPHFSKAFRRASLLHYAGHATYAGQGGWDSYLVMANDARLTVGDILSLSGTAPPIVILSGCETGRSDAQAQVRLGLAQSFLLKGAKMVIVTTRPIADRDGLDFMTKFYETKDDDQDLARTLATVQRMYTQENIDWAAFRILVP